MAAAAGGARAATTQAEAAAVAGAAGAPSSCRGEYSASPSGLAEGTGQELGCEALPPIPPPFSRRLALPSGHSADGRAWAGSWPRLFRPGPARQRAGGWESAAPGLHPVSLGAAMLGDNEM